MKQKILILFLVFNLGCFNTKKENDSKAKDNNNNFIKQINLPSALNEISGLAADREDNLFAHNDELGLIFELDKKNGQVIKKFQLGRIGIEADFEGMAIAGERFFLLESNGILYEFAEGDNNSKVDIKKYDLNFSSNYEFEGLCYDRKKNGLLIACKDYQGKKFKNGRPIFFFSLKSGKVFTEPLYIVDVEELKKGYKIKDFYPSGISISPLDGFYYLLSSKGEPCLVVLSDKGKILSAEKLNKKLHYQPEAITFLSDGTMIIGDEKVKKSATLSFYSPGESGRKNGN